MISYDMYIDRIELRGDYDKDCLDSALMVIILLKLIRLVFKVIKRMRMRGIRVMH